ncbi:MAG: flagellar hook capping FlgD N-terminal domain-containing protein [Balneolales bacterium]
MDINGIMGAQSSSPLGSADNSKEMGKEEFLQLLIAQMRHQDPLNPMEGTEFASQLAQFNSVEQLINVNGGIANLAAAQDMMSTGLNNSLAATLTGKSVTVMSNQIGFDGSDASEMKFRLNNLASEINIEVRDASGSVVRTETLENYGAGDHSWSWDGKTSAGQTVPEGTYSFEIAAKNEDDEVSVLSFIEGTAERVRFTGEGVKLLVNGVLLPLEDVEQIGI